MPTRLPLLLNTGGTAPPPPPAPIVSSLIEENPRTLKRFGPSNLIVDQVPDFVNKDHPTFRSFVEAYYEWMEEYQNPFGIIDAFTEHTDIDQSIGLFLADFRAMYLRNFPLQLARDSSGNIVNEANFVRNARKFYGAKGTEKAFRFLFRLLYNASSEVKYPSKDILKCSGGRWLELRSLRTTNNGGTANFQMAGNQVYQLNSLSNQVLAYGTVTEVVQYTDGPYSINEIFLKDMFGEFSPGSPVYCDTANGRISEIAYPVVSSVEILDRGVGYSDGDLLLVTDVGDCVVPQFSITGVDPTGKIIGVDILNPGVNCPNTLKISVVSNSGNGDARISVRIGALSGYRGYYIGNTGKISSTTRLFDGDYHQDFAYVLRSEISLSTYKELYKKLVHPAGFKMFGEILMTRNVVDQLPFHSEMQRYENPFIGHYTPYRLGTTADLQPIYPSGFNPRGTTYSSYQSYGASGGKLIVEALGGFTFNDGASWQSIASRGSASNTIFSNVFEFVRLGPTLGVFYLKTIDFDLINTSTVLGGGFVQGNTLTMINPSASAYTGSILYVRNGLGIVPETGGFTHDTQNSPLGSSSGVEGYIEAQGLSYSYWSVYHHPNTRSIKGLTGVLNGDCGEGASFSSIALNPFFRMPIGYHFHSNPGGTPYLGTTGTNNEYGLIESNDLTSPNY
jgi:hypothetical protein